MGLHSGNVMEIEYFEDLRKDGRMILNKDLYEIGSGHGIH
jgi:hypothetical protein